MAPSQSNGKAEIVPLTINIINGTCWPPASCATTCIDGAKAETINWISSLVTCYVYVEIGWISLGGAVGNNFRFYSGTDTWAQFYDRIKAQPTDGVKSVAYATLSSASNPSPYSDYPVTEIYDSITRNVNSSGLIGIYSQMNFNSDLGLGSYDWTPDGTTCAGGKYSAFGLWQQEFGELGLGRDNRSGVLQNGPASLWTWQSSGSRNFSSGTGGTRYFSYDEGVTNRGNLRSDDASEFIDFNFVDMYGFGSPGFVALPTQNDLRTIMANGIPFSDYGKQLAGFTSTDVPSTTVAGGFGGKMQAGSATFRSHATDIPHT